MAATKDYGRRGNGLARIPRRARLDRTSATQGELTCGYTTTVSMMSLEGTGPIVRWTVGLLHE